MLALIKKSQIVIPDSGGFQKEAYWAQIPCITLRDETEWIETLENGWNRLWSPSTNTAGLSDFYTDIIRQRPVGWQLIYGDGKSAKKIVAAIKGEFRHIKVLTLKRFQ